MRLHLPLLLALTLGCGNTTSDDDDDDKGSDDEPVDSDGDGWRDDEDCEPDDPDIHPDAVEICNGLDDDCNEEVDDEAQDAAVFYQDSDGDGFGVETDTETACDVPDGYAELDGDCDDSRADAFPGAADEEPELCSVDSDGDGFGDATLTAPLEAGTDCDDTQRRAHPGAADEEPLLCTIDADRDGFGSALLTAPLEAGTDCDDTERRAHPGAAEEEPLLCALDYDNDGYGDEDATAPIEPGTDCDDGDRNTHPGASEASRALLEDLACDGGGVASLGDAEYILEGETGNDHAGQSVSPLGDLDGDGLADFAVGVPGGDGDNYRTGFVQIVLGATITAASEGQVELADMDFALLGENENDDAGYAIAGAGDVDGDGLGDILVGAPLNDEAGAGSGAAYLIYSSTFLASGGSMSLADADVRFVGAGRYDALGRDVSSAGDVDGDGLADILIGSIYGESALVFLASSLSGPSGTTLSFDDADYTFTDSDRGGYIGQRVASAGDVDGDGLSDILLGSPSTTNGTCYGCGVTYLVYGSTLTATTQQSLDLATDAIVLLGEDNYDKAGYDVASAGDVDGDGLMDIIIGAYTHSRMSERAGSAYIMLAASLNTLSPGGVSLSDADYHLYGEAENDYAGYAVASAGDVDGDGKGDVVVGAYSNAETGVNAGKAYVVRGSVLAESTSPYIPLATADFGFTGERIGDYAAIAVSAAGDVDGDGLTDLLVGAPDASRAGWTYSGKAYLLLSQF